MDAAGGHTVDSERDVKVLAPAEVMLSRREVLERGVLRPSQIRLLGTADRLVLNPHGVRLAGVRVWRLSWVIRVENSL